MPVVDAVVDDRDLHSLAGGRQPRAPERGRADGGRAAVELGPVAELRCTAATPSTCSSRRRNRRGRRPQARSGRPGSASGPAPPGRRLRSGRPPAPARRRSRVSRRSVERASRSSRPCVRGSCDRAADGDESSTTTCTMRPSETGAGPRAEASAGSAAKSKTPRKTARLRRGIVRTRRKEFGRSGCTIQSGERRIDAQGMRLRLLRNRLRLHGLRLLEAGFRGGERARLQWPSARMWRNW